jgi:prepilin-type N-terminal cleavage/methylation domain-containing protein
MARRADARRAMTLLELTAVTVIVGLLAAMAALRFGTATLADVGAEGFAQQLALDCLQARRAAIATGDNHLVRFTIASGQATQYAVYRRSGVSTTQIDQVNAKPADLSVTTTATDLEFTFTGEALASYTVTITAPDRTISVTIPQVTGKAFVQ